MTEDRQQQVDPSHRTQPVAAVLLVYAVILLLYLASSFFPEYRLWGANAWAFAPLPTRLAAFGVAMVVPMLMTFFLRKRAGVPVPPEDGGRAKIGWLVVLVVIPLVYFLAYYSFRTETHFLGDGYTLIGLLADENPLIKSRQIGESLVHIWVKGAIGGDGEEAALASFRVVSIGAGMAHALIAVIAARFLFKQLSQQLLFILLLVTSGYTLLFFGYVENYSLFIVSVVSFCLVGAAAAGHRLSKWWLVPIQLLCVAFHVLGVTLIPATVYLLTAETALGRRLGRTGTAVKWVLTVVVVVGVIGAIYYLRSRSLFVRFAVLPITEGRFTIEGYTMFSLTHLIDYANLAVVLLPGLGVAVAALVYPSQRTRSWSHPARFLLVASVASAAAAFLFDPKLGMPRDWDLFAYSSAPAVILISWLLLGKPADHNRLPIIPITCLVCLNLLLLSLRVYTQTSPETSIALLESYTTLDRAKSKNIRLVLVDYYRKQGLDSAANREIERWSRDYPQRRILKSAEALKDAGQYRQALRVYHQVIEIDPVYHSAWSHMGGCFLQLRHYDSALKYFHVAEGLNPHDYVTQNNLGTAYLNMLNLDQAEAHLLRAISLGNPSMTVRANLGRLYLLKKDFDRTLKYLREAASYEDADAMVFKDLGDCLIYLGRFKEAAGAYERALNLGLDSSYVRTLQERYPSLR